MKNLDNSGRQCDVYKSNWWSMRLQAGWTAHENADCVSFSAGQSGGVLQVSSIRKPNGPVTSRDLHDFASDSKGGAKSIQHVELGESSGIASEYVRGKRYWREWWLKKGQTAVYVTYNVAVAEREAEVDAVDKMISSITILPA
jgi:hypothetical protein